MPPKNRENHFSLQTQRKKVRNHQKEGKGVQNVLKRATKALKVKVHFPCYKWTEEEFSFRTLGKKLVRFFRTRRACKLARCTSKCLYKGFCMRRDAPVASCDAPVHVNQPARPAFRGRPVLDPTTPQRRAGATCLCTGA